MSSPSGKRLGITDPHCRAPELAFITSSTHIDTAENAVQDNFGVRGEIFTIKSHGALETTKILEEDPDYWPRPTTGRDRTEHQWSSSLLVCARYIALGLDDTGVSDLGMDDMILALCFGGPSTCLDWALGGKTLYWFLLASLNDMDERGEHM